MVTCPSSAVAPLPDMAISSSERVMTAFASEAETVVAVAEEAVKTCPVPDEEDTEEAVSVSWLVPV